LYLRLIDFCISGSQTFVFKAHRLLKKDLHDPVDLFLELVRERGAPLAVLALQRHAQLVPLGFRVWGLGSNKLIWHI